DRRQRESEQRRRQEPPHAAVEEPEQQAREDRRTERREPRAQAAQDRAAEQSLLADRRRHRGEQQRERERTRSLRGRDHVPELVDQLLGRRQHPLGQQTDDQPGRRADQDRARDGQRRRLAQAQDGREAIAVAPRVSGGEAEQTDQLNQKRPGRQPPGLQRREREQQHHRDAEQRERVARRRRRVAG